MKVKSIADVSAKWAKRAGAATPEYEAGLGNPKADWAAATQAANAAYQSGVQEAIGRGAFPKGVREAGSEKWSRKALAVGKVRYGPGVTAGLSDYTAGEGPYLDALGRISYPAKGNKGAAQNIERVRAVMDAMRAQKTGGR
jgi:hypothetical protein